MIILLDADGPLFDLVGESVRRTNHAFASDYTPAMWTQWGAHFMTDHQRKALEGSLWRDEDFWRNLPVTAGAKEGVAQLRQAGHEIHVVTSSWVSCRGWEHARREALRREFDVEAKFVTVTAQKHLIHGDVFVDDKPEHVEAWGRKWWSGHDRRIHALLFDMPHNESAPGHARVNWADIVELYG